MARTLMQRRKPYVHLVTELGSVSFELFDERAPESSEAFLALVENGSFARAGAFHRAVRASFNDHTPTPIDVVQAGLIGQVSQSTITHEPTSKTGLKHVDGALSLARPSIGAGTGADIFICLGSHRCLDAGGARHLDTQGFAVFGQVVKGLETIREIHKCGDVNQKIDPPIKILAAWAE